MLSNGSDRWPVRWSVAGAPATPSAPSPGPPSPPSRQSTPPAGSLSAATRLTINPHEERSMVDEIRMVLETGWCEGARRATGGRAASSGSRATSTQCPSRVPAPASVMDDRRNGVIRRSWSRKRSGGRGPSRVDVTRHALHHPAAVATIWPAVPAWPRHCSRTDPNLDKRSRGLINPLHARYAGGTPTGTQARFRNLRGHH